MPFWLPQWLTATARVPDAQTQDSGRTNSATISHSQRQERATDSQKAIDKRVLGVKGGRIEPRMKSPKTPRQKTKSRQQALERDSVVRSIESDYDEPNASGAPVILAHAKGETTDVDSDSDFAADSEDASELDAGEKKDTATGAIIVAGPHLDREDPANADWSSVEADLYDLLQDCGAEPMLPMSWKLDFPMLPDACFTEYDEEVIIGAQQGKDHHGIRALKDLFASGSRARGRSLHGSSPAKLLERAIEKYVKWSLYDGGVANASYIPVHCIQVAREDAIGDALGDIDKAMYEIRDRYRALDFGKVPVIFGIVIAESVMTFFGLDTAKDQTEPKPIAVFDWAAEGQDAWGAMAVAILAMMVRGTLQDIWNTQEDAEG